MPFKPEDPVGILKVYDTGLVKTVNSSGQDYDVLRDLARALGTFPDAELVRLKNRRAVKVREVVVVSDARAFLYIARFRMNGDRRWCNVTVRPLVNGHPMGRIPL